MKYYVIALFLTAVIAASVLVLVGCSKSADDDNGAPGSYTQISMQDAIEMMERDDGHIVVDVRRHDEFDAGHIPGAVCIPNETITEEAPTALPDKDQIILIYCRSGRRSKEASQKLCDMGYTNVYEFGGIIDWTGDVVTEDAAENVADTEVAADTAKTERETLLVIDSGNAVMRAHFEDNASADALAEKLKDGAVTLELHDYGGFEKVGPLPFELPTSDERITTEPGDVILYQGNQLTVYYAENTWSFTRLAKIEGATAEDILHALSGESVTVTLYLEEVNK